MKTIVCKNPNNFEVAEVEKPVLKKGEALIKMKRIGICGTDIHAYHGRQPFFSYPRVLGHELAGEIVELSNETDLFEIGNKVTIIPYLECGECIACRNGKTNCCVNLQVLGVHTDGGMQEYLNIPYSHLIKVDELSFEQAATVECLSIGAHAVRRASIQKDEWVLVIGAGPIGLGVMQFAMNAGAKVIMLDRSAERLAFCKNWAASVYIVNGGGDVLQHIKDITNGDMPTVVFDATGNAQSMNEAYQFAAHSGRLVYVGLVQADLQFPDPEIHKRELTILSSRNATRQDFNTVITALKEKKFNVAPFITNIVPFDNLPCDFEKIFAAGNSNIKVLVELL